MIGKVPPKKLKPGDELVCKWLNDVRDSAVEGSIAALGPGLKGSPTSTGWQIGLANLGGGTTGAFYCMSNSGAWGATGSWPSLTPGSITADVYQALGTDFDLVVSSATIRNWFPASPANAKVLMVFPDGTGDYVAGPQSCV